VNSVNDFLISEHRENCNSLSDCYCPSVNTTWRTARLIQDFMEHAEHALIVGRLDVDVQRQSFAPIDLHETDAVSVWLLIKRLCTG
jgi:hypothetical protein